MNWLTLALSAPFLWAITNHIDKYLLSRYFKNVDTGAMMIFSAAIGFVLLPVAYLNGDVFDIDLGAALLLTLGGMIWISATFPYLKALAVSEATLVIPVFQLIPIFTYIAGAVFLGEHLSLEQVLAGGLIITGAVVLSLDLTARVSVKGATLGWMLLSASMFATGSVIFKLVALENDFWKSSFYQYLGYSVVATALFVFGRTYRQQFIAVFKSNKLSLVGINVANELINIAAKLALDAASLLAPLALVWVVSGSQPLFVFVMGVFLTLFLPHIAKEDISRKVLAQKILGIVIIICGSILLNSAI